MHDEAHVAFVHTHPKGVCGDDHLQLAALKVVLHAVAFTLLSSAVIIGCPDAPTLQDARQHLRFAPRTDVNQAGLRIRLEHGAQRLEFGGVARHVDDAVRQIRAVEARDDLHSVTAIQHLENLELHVFRRGRRHRSHGRIAQQLSSFTEPPILGAKIVTPLRHAVRLVNH